MATTDHLGPQFQFHKQMTPDESKAAATRTAEQILQKWAAHPETQPGWQHGGNRGRV